MRPHTRAGISGLWLVLAACSDLSLAMRAELMRLPEPGPLASQGAAALSVPPWTSNVTLTSVRSPITSIEIRGGSETIVLYNCPGATAADCLVELNSTALESLLPTSPVAASPGTYDEVIVYYCKPGDTGWNVRLTGTTTLGGTTYYTKGAGNQLGTTGPAQPVTVRFDGCGSIYAIVPPLVVSDETATTILLRLYFDIRDLAFAALNHASTNQLLLGPGCSGASTTGFICASYTTVFAVPGTNVPTMERYRVNDVVTIGLAFEAPSDRFVGGYSRRYYIEDLGFSPGFSPDGHYDTFTTTGPSTYRLTQRPPNANEFPAFQRATHTGTLISNTGMSVPYTAVRLP